LRWDLNQIFGMAVAEGHLGRNPAAMLFTPREAPRPKKPTMTSGQVALLFSVLQPRELAICMLAMVAGMRPSEIFGLKWQHVKSDRVEIEQRLYRGKIDSPKTDRSTRTVALSEGLKAAIGNWRTLSAVQLGHSVDVNLNVYTQTGLGQRKEAVNTLESALRIM
jgi:integrase